jgi:WD40 repeat protein
LRIWDLKTGQAASRLKPQSPDIYWTTVSDNGKMAISFDRKKKSLGFHDLATGKVTREAALAAEIPPMVLSPAGDKLVCADGNLRNAVDRKELVEVGRFGWPNRSVKFSADGRMLVAAVVAKRLETAVLSSPPAEEIAVIDPSAAKELRRISKRIGTEFYVIDAAALSSDGKMVVAALRDKRKWDEPLITLWETETGRERGHFRGHRGRTNSIAISADGRFIVTGADDTTALVWDAAKPRTWNALLRPGDLATHLKNLAGTDAEQAYASMWALQSAPKQTVSFLGDQNSLFARTDVRVIERWIRDLDSDTFAERERASEELGQIVDEAEAHLKKALESKPTLEMRRRIKLLLEERRTGPTGKELQGFRVIEILEHIAASNADPAPGAKAARLAVIAVLKKLAAGAAELRPTREARAALERLERRAGGKP